MIYLTQWLCTSRHCSIALVWDDKVDSQETIVEKGDAIYRSRLVNRWCGICGANVEPEHAPTRFTTVDDALAGLACLAAELTDRPQLPAWENPKCICRPDTAAAMVCPYGHLLECHYPQTCDEAECSHYQVQRDIDAGLYDLEVP